MEKVKTPNYYQITSFINLLAAQLKKFSRNMLFSAESIIDGRNHGIDLKDIRIFTINNFIGFTRYFTEGGFINLINNRKEKYNPRASQFINEDKENEDAIKELADVGEEETRNQLISFDKINPSLLLFQENGEHFRIISNLKNKEETTRYLRLIRTQDPRYQMPVLKVSKEIKDDKNNKENEQKIKDEIQRM